MILRLSRRQGAIGADLRLKSQEPTALMVVGIDAIAVVSIGNGVGYGKLEAPIDLPLEPGLELVHR